MSSSTMSHRICNDSYDYDDCDDDDVLAFDSYDGNGDEDLKDNKVKLNIK